MKTIAKVLGLMSAISLLGLTFARDYNGFGRIHFFGGFFSWLVPLLFITLLVLTILVLFQWFKTRHDPVPPYKTTEVFSGDSALHILRERLAKGEIDPEDYEVRRQVLINKE